MCNNPITMHRWPTTWTYLVSALFLVISPFVTDAAADYKTFYLERFCDGDAGKSIQLSGSGRLSAATIKYAQSKSIGSRLSRTCSLIVRAPDGYDVVVAVREVKLQGVLGKCDEDLKVFTSPGEGRSYCRVAKDRWEKTTQSTKGLQSHVVFNVSHSLSISKRSFEITVTAAKRGTCLNDSEFFQCSNNLCVSKKLTCDGHNNCGDGTDENSECTVKPGSIITILVVVALLLIVGAVIAYFVIKTRRGKHATRVIETTVSEPLDPATQTSYQPPYQPADLQPYPPQGYPPPAGGPPPPGMMYPPAGGYPGYPPPADGTQYPMQSPYNPAPVGAGGFGSSTVAPPPPGPYPPMAGAGYPQQGGYPPYGAPPAPYPTN